MTYECAIEILRLVLSDNDNMNVQKALSRIDHLICKNEKYRWHDLRKNPNDLPKEGQKIIATDGQYYFSGEVFDRCGGVVIKTILYQKDDYYTSSEEYIFDSELIAWRKIEPFEVTG